MFGRKIFLELEEERVVRRRRVEGGSVGEKGGDWVGREETGGEVGEEETGGEVGRRGEGEVAVREGEEV